MACAKHTQWGSAFVPLCMSWEEHVSVPGDSWGDLHSRRNWVWGQALDTAWEGRCVCQETGSLAKEAGEVSFEE